MRHPNLDRSVLVTLAILNVNWDEAGVSYIHNFVPFVADCLKRMDQSVVSIDDLQAKLEEVYGLQIPRAAIMSVVGRAARDGLLTRKHGALHPIPEALAPYDLSDKRARMARENEALISKFHDFCEIEMGVHMSRGDTEDVLLAFLEDRSLPVLTAAIRGGGGGVPPLEIDTGKSEYLVSSFIAHAFERDPDGFDYLMQVVKGGMLATALYLPNAGGDGGRKLTSLHVYLDTPFLLQALGWHDRASEDAAIELMDLLKTLGARLACFEHTEAEIRGVLNGAANALRFGRRPGERPSPSQVVQTCVSEGIGPSDLERKAATLEPDLGKLGVELTRSDGHGDVQRIRSTPASIEHCTG